MWDGIPTMGSLCAVIPVYAQVCVRSYRSVGMHFPGKDVWQQPALQTSLGSMFLPGELFPGAPCFWAMSLEKSSLQLIFPRLMWVLVPAICFVLWQSFLLKADQPSSVDRLGKLFPQNLHQIKNYSLNFLPSFSTSQEKFTLFLKNKKKYLKYCPKIMSVWENPYSARGGNSRDIATITVVSVYVCSPQNMKNGTKYN